MFTRQYFILLFLCLSCLLRAQTHISVLDSRSGERIAFQLQLDDSIYHASNNGLSLDLIKSTIAVISAEGFMSTERILEPNKAYSFYLFPSVQEIEGIVITDIHSTKNAHETVLNVSRISAKRIEDLGAVDLRDALSFENNIRLSRDNALGTSGLSLMGMGGNNVKLMVDGVPVIGRLFDQLDLEQFNLENTQQIEIIKGPMSVIYGSNALAGTINIISNKSQEKKATLKANHETDGQYNISGTYVIPIKKHSISLSGGRMLFNGWSAEDIDRTFDWIPKEQYNGRIGYLYQSDSLQISYRSEFLHSFLIDRGTPLAPYNEFAIDQHYTNIRLDNSISIYRNWKHSNLSIIAGNNRFKRLKNKYYKNLVNLEELLIPQSGEQDTQFFNAYVLRSIYGFNHSRYETLLGVDINLENGEGARLLNQEQAQSDYAIFSSSEMKIKKNFIFRTGLRYAYNSAFKAPLLYSVQTRLNLPKNQVLKVAYGKGFRAPSLKELYLDFTDSRHEVYGNDKLKSENSHSLTSSYQKFSQRGLLQLNTNVDLFFNHIENKIELLVLGPVSATYGNIGVYETVGGSIAQQVKYLNYSLNASFNYTGIYNGIAGQGKRFNFSPQWVVQPSYTNKDKGFSANLFINYFGKLARVFSDTASGNLNINEMDDYTMIDVTLNKQLLSKKIKLTLGSRNLLNIQSIQAKTEIAAHTESSSSISISPGRTFFISIRYSFYE